MTCGDSAVIVAIRGASCHPGACSTARPSRVSGAALRTGTGSPTFVLLPAAFSPTESDRVLHSAQRNPACGCIQPNGMVRLAAFSPTDCCCSPSCDLRVLRVHVPLFAWSCSRRRCLVTCLRCLVTCRSPLSCPRSLRRAGRHRGSLAPSVWDHVAPCTLRRAGKHLSRQQSGTSRTGCDALNRIQGGSAAGENWAAEDMEDKRGVGFKHVTRE